MGGGATYFLTAALALIMLSTASSAADSDVAEHCGNDFNKVTDCLTYATGKAPTPTKECCTAMTSIRASDAACLCYVIELTHNGSEQIRSLGIQEARLIQLPSACNIKNASISDCPKLLGIPPSSPLYSIFTNTTSSAAASPVTTSPGTNSSSAASEGTKLIHYHFTNIALPFVLSAISYIA